FWVLVDIQNSTMQDNNFLTSGFYVYPGQTGRGTYNITRTPTSSYTFCLTAAHNYPKGFTSLLGCRNIVSTLRGAISPDLVWHTSVAGGQTTNWNLHVSNLASRYTTYNAIMTWQCFNPNIGWMTCHRGTRTSTLSPGQSIMKTISFTPLFNSIPSGTNLTVNVYASYSFWRLQENTWVLAT
ncbi:MAG: hypothetical protein ACHQ1H_03010, partial [Nitrososphaerales archaeon]